MIWLLGTNNEYTRGGALFDSPSNLMVQMDQLMWRYQVRWGQVP